VIKDTLVLLVYNFNKCRFQPGEGKSRKVISLKGKGKVPNLAESKRGENIIAFKCVSVDGWHIDP
jgi:hypothetical protein